MAVNLWFDATLDKSLTRLRPVTTLDAYGNTALDWSAPTSLTLKARIRLAATGEDMSGRDAVSSDLDVWVATDDVLATDRVVVGGVTYEVVGQPGSRTDLDGSYWFTKFLLREVTG